jgi:beta-phosphoglucomutase
MKNIEAVIFDLDGVITDTAHFHFLAWRNLARDLGVDFTLEFNEKLKGISRAESLEKILVLGNLQNKYSREEKEILASRKNIEYVELLKDMKESDIYPGIKELIMELRENNIKVALASASKNAPIILKALKITELFDHIVDPDSVANGKPAPDIFLAGAKAVGADPENCVGVEDAEAGIKAILDAKMFPVGVGTPNQMKQAGAKLIVANTKELTLDLILENIRQAS